MRSKKLHILSTLVLSTSLLLVTPTNALAVVMNLNGQTGQTQTFQDDSNVTVSSSNNVHSFGWNGILPFSRGGTGANAFTAGSVLFSNGTSFTQNNANFFWDNVNNRLGLGTSSPAFTLDVLGDTSISGNLVLGTNFDSSLILTPDAVSPDSDGTSLEINTGSALGDAHGGNLTLQTGDGGFGGNITLLTGSATNNDSGTISLTTGSNLGAIAGNIELVGGNGTKGSNLIMTAGSGSIEAGRVGLRGGNGLETINGGDIGIESGAAEGSGSGGRISLFAGGSATGSPGFVQIMSNDNVGNGATIFDTSLLSEDRTFTFPDFSGTSGLLEADQTWSGLNLFEAGSKSTIYVGSNTKTGCIALGDSDGSGITWITTNDGVLNASSTKPSVCQ